MKATQDIILGPMLSEKSTNQRFAQNYYVFRVKLDANKVEIKKAVESRFNVIVDGVQTVTTLGKTKRTRGVAGQQSTWKKAFVKVRKGDTISEFEGA